MYVCGATLLEGSQKIGAAQTWTRSRRRSPWAMDVLSRDTGASASQAEEGMANARKQVENAMLLAANILCSSTSLKLMKVIMRFGSLSHERHNDHVVRCKTQRGGMAWWAEESVGAWEQTFFRLPAALMDERLLLEIGFAPTQESMTEQHAEYG